MSVDKKRLEELDKMIVNGNIPDNLLPVFTKIVNMLWSMQFDIEFFKEKWFSGKDPNEI